MLLTTLALALEQPRSFLDACQRAPAAAVVEVTGQESRWSEVGIETWVDVVVLEPRFGELPADLTLVSLGGRIGGVEMKVADSPRLADDHRYLLLLAPRQDGRWSLFGGALGVASVELATEACRAP